jgi:hypothetical protein
MALIAFEIEPAFRDKRSKAGKITGQAVQCIFQTRYAAKIS